MGADLITNSVIIPDKKFMGILKHGILKLEKGLTTARTQEDLEKIGVSFDGRYGQCDGEFDMEDARTAINADIAELKTIKQLGDLMARDLGYHAFTVNGVAVTLAFAGEMTWGDEPEGYGYETLGRLCDLGFATELYNAIPWDIRKKK